MTRHSHRWAPPLYQGSTGRTVKFRCVRCSVIVESSNPLQPSKQCVEVWNGNKYKQGEERPGCARPDIKVRHDRANRL